MQLNPVQIVVSPIRAENSLPKPGLSRPQQTRRRVKTPVSCANSYRESNGTTRTILVVLRVAPVNGPSRVMRIGKQSCSAYRYASAGGVTRGLESPGFSS